MITLFLSIALICITSLVAQYQANIHRESIRAGRGRIQELERRIAALEALRKQEFDPAAFEDLKGKVEALRLVQGLRSR